MANNPSYAAASNTGIGQVSVANTNRDGTGTIATVFTAGSNGSRIDGVVVKATGTTTAGMVRLFIHDGTNARLLTEIAIPANTVSATNPSFEAQLRPETYARFLPITLPNGFSLRASTQVAETFNVIAFGGNF
jgi:hypothetical protein